MTVEERSGPLGQPYSRDELWAESRHLGLALENGRIDRLRRDVDRLAVEIGPRNIYHYEALQKAADYLETSLRETGYSPLLHRYETQGKAFFNISAELPGREHKDEIIVIGAHYDTHKDSPGANDNGSAIAVPTYCPGTWSSDHWSFWREGFPALMATDTAPLRYPYYHTRADTPDKVNFGWLSQIVSGFRAVIADVAKSL